jgi:hypothetical protein
MTQPTPTREALLRLLDQLAADTVSRAEVATWALALVDDDEQAFADRAVLQGLKRLGSVDLPSSDRRYLYGDEDFAGWRADLLRG